MAANESASVNPAWIIGGALAILAFFLLRRSGPTVLQPEKDDSLARAQSLSALYGNLAQLKTTEYLAEQEVYGLKLKADRDIQVAQIQAGAASDIANTRSRYDFWSTFATSAFGSASSFFSSYFGNYIPYQNRVGSQSSYGVGNAGLAAALSTPSYGSGPGVSGYVDWI